MKIDKKLLVAAVGAVAGGGALYYAGTQIDQTDYATKDPDGAYKAKLAGGAAAAVVGAVLLAYGKTIPGAILLAGGGGMAAEAYHVHSAMPPPSAPPPPQDDASQGTGAETGSGPTGDGAGPASNFSASGPVIMPRHPAANGPVIKTRHPAKAVPEVRTYDPVAVANNVLSQFNAFNAGAAMRVGMPQSGAAMRAGIY